VPGEECAHRLGVGRLAQSGRAGDVAEEDGDRLPLLAGWSGSLEGRAAGETEAGAFGVALRAVRTERHVLRLDPPVAEHNGSRERVPTQYGTGPKRTAFKTSPDQPRPRQMPASGWLPATSATFSRPQQPELLSCS